MSLLLLFGGGPAAVTEDAASSSSSAVAVASLTWSHTVGTQANRVLLVGVSIADALGQSVTGVTYGGVALTKLSAISNGTTARAEVWYLIAPASGTANIVASLSAAAVLVGGASSLYNVDQADSFGAVMTASGSGTAVSDALGTDSAQDLAHDVVASAATSLTAGGGQTERWNVGVAGVAGAGSTRPGTGGAVTMAWTNGISAAWAQVAVDVHAVGSGVTDVPGIDSTAVVPGPTISETLYPGTIASSAVVPGPTIAETLYVGTIASTASVGAPNVFFPLPINLGAIGSSAVVVGPSIVQTGVIPPPAYTPRLTADVVNRAGALVVALPNSFKRTWQDVLDDVGSHGCEVQADDAAVPSVPYRSIIRYSLDGVARFAGLIESKHTKAVDPGEEANETVEFKGRGTLAIWEEAVTYPEQGLGSLPFSDTRLFSYASTKFDSSGWGSSFVVKQQSNPATPYPNAPSGWPDPTAYWIWAVPFASPQPVGDCYFRKTFTIAAETTVRVFCTADDGIELYIDGALVLSETKAYLWGTTKQSDIFLSAGTHTVAVKGTNIARPASPSTNIAAILVSLMAINADGTLGSVIVNTDSTWQSVGYPTVVPGFTPGQILRILMQEAQARGTLTGVSLGFTDTNDSAGQPWPIIGEVSVAVGLDYLSVIRQLTDTYIDVRMDVGLPVLRAYDSLGSASGASLVPGTNLTSLDHTGTV